VSKIRRISFWRTVDLDRILDQGDILYKSLGLNRFLDVDDLPCQFQLESFVVNIKKLNLESFELILDERAINPLPSFPSNCDGALLFIAGTVTAIFSFSRNYYIFDPHSRDERGLPSARGTSVLLKFNNLFEVHNYMKFAYLTIFNRYRIWFQLQFMKLNVDDIVQSNIYETFI